MYQIYAGTLPERYRSKTRSLRIQGCVTSIRLEKEFWLILEEMAGETSSTTSELINLLYIQVYQNFGEVCNFTSFLRTSCTIYLAKKNSPYELPAELIAEAG